MARFRKRAMQSPWLQVLLGSAAGAMQDIKAERERQNEYARKVALMSVEQGFRAQEKSQEQELATTNLQEQRAYSERQTQEQRQYAQQLQDTEREQGYQREITQYDPTGQVAAAFNPSGSSWSGDAGVPTSSIQAALAQALSDIQSLKDPAGRVAEIERYNPATAIGDEKYVQQVFYGALKPTLQDAKKALEAIDRANGILVRGPEDGKQVEWYQSLTGALKGFEWTSQYEDLAKQAQTILKEQRTQKPEKPEQTAAEKQAEKVAAGELDVIKGSVKERPKYVFGQEFEETPSQRLGRAAQDASVYRIAAGVGNAADSTRAGVAPEMPDPLSSALSGNLSPDQLAGMRAQGAGTPPGAAMPQQERSIMPPEVAAAMGQPPTVPAVGAMVPGQRVPSIPPGSGVEAGTGGAITPMTPAMGGPRPSPGPRTMDAAQKAVRAGKASSVEDAIQQMIAFGIDVSL